MKVNEFVEKYTSIKIDKLKDSYIKDNLNVKKYVGIADKINLVERIVNATMFVFKNDEITNEIKSDTIGRFLLTTLSIIDVYTDIEIDYGNIMEEYDLLSKDNIINILIGENGVIPQSEVSEINVLISMRVDDVIQNNFTTHAFIQNQVTRFSEMIGSVFAPIMERISDILENIDDKTVEKIKKQIEKLTIKTK